MSLCRFYLLLKEGNKTFFTDLKTFHLKLICSKFAWKFILRRLFLSSTIPLWSPLREGCSFLFEQTLIPLTQRSMCCAKFLKNSNFISNNAIKNNAFKVLLCEKKINNKYETPSFHRDNNKLMQYCLNAMVLFHMFFNRSWNRHHGYLLLISVWALFSPP